MVMVEGSLAMAMNAKIIGSGDRTMVLAHGYGGEQSLWEKIVPHFTERFTVVVFDWSFSGACNESVHESFDASKYSSYDGFSEDLISLVEEMNLKRFVFVGHSMSGMIGCIASIKRPELFERLVLIGASPRYINTEDYEGGFEVPVIESILSCIECDFHSWAMNFSTLVVDPKDPLSTDKLRTSLQRMRPDIALSIAKTVFLSDSRDILDKVEVPCTIIQTTNDIVVPMPVCDYMEKKMKKIATVEVIEADGHLPQLTCHQLVIDILDKVMGSHSS